jgi:Glycine zipper
MDDEAGGPKGSPAVRGEVYGHGSLGSCGWPPAYDRAVRPMAGDKTMTRCRKQLLLLLSAVMLFSMPTLTGAQMYIYPARGQSPQQEESDKGQCYGWAVQQTGFDPANPQVVAAPPPPSYYPQPQAPQGGLFRGAFGGAALGAIGGAIGGDAGKGAAIGAGVGGLFGMMRRHRYMEEEQQMQQQAQQQQGYMSQEQNALARGRGNYNRGFSACMTARGYTVN